VDKDDIEKWTLLKHGPIEITVEARECSRCDHRGQDGCAGTCVCVDEALGDGAHAGND
jgi:hypothetical protein